MDVKTPEEEFANIAFELLDKASLIKVLERMDPKGVLALCQTNRFFAEICQDDSVFVDLMKVHYPGFPINRDAKAQYMAIAGGEGTRYYIPYVYYRTPPPMSKAVELKPGQKAPEDTLEFEILGTRIQKPEKVYVLLRKIARIGGGASRKVFVFTDMKDVQKEIATGEIRKTTGVSLSDQILGLRWTSVLKKEMQNGHPVGQPRNVLYYLFPVTLP